MSSLEKPSPSQPPSEPQRQKTVGPVPGGAPSSLGTSRLTETAADAILGGDRPARLQMIAALVLGLVLVAIPLYLWRRPRSEAVTVTSEAQAAIAASSAGVAAGAAGATGAAGANANAAARGVDADTVLLSEARVLECHDPGSKHTAATDCDHLAPIEKSLATAIKDNASCLPTAAGGGTLVYVVDVSFQRKRNPVALTVPKDGRALRNLVGSPKASAAAANACGSSVKHALSGVSLDGVPHEHQRYKIAITATYNAK